MLKKVALVVFVVVVIIQFIQPAKNLSDDNTYHISKKYRIPEEVNTILEVACNDCHSNKTRYPWYAKMQPSAWFLHNHVTEGKEHLNFSEFTNLSIARQNHKFEETIEMVEEKEMPLKSYTYFGLHKEANLSDKQRELLISWAREQMAMLKATYPADSLVLKKRKKSS
ncbi:MAG: heme-binding domain-containing protein [Bacteroidetes bacterium]|nr:heme-binding domain-containing protein [Bacteroidota bacterium]